MFLPVTAVVAGVLAFRLILPQAHVIDFRAARRGAPGAVGHGLALS